MWPQIRKWKSINSISVFAINNARDREQFDEPAAGAVTRKINSGDSQRLWLICHDLEKGERGRNNFKCLQSGRWYPCDVPLTTGSLKVQSARHSLAAIGLAAIEMFARPPEKENKSKKEKDYIYGWCFFDASVFHLSIIIIAKTSRGSRPPIAITARICQKWRKKYCRTIELLIAG